MKKLHQNPIKQKLRKSALELRQDLYSKGIIKDKSILIADKILNSSDYKKASDIALYYPFGSEIDLSCLLKQNGKNFYLPKTNGLDMDFVKYEGVLKEGEYGIKTPLGAACDPYCLDLIYIPCLMANDKGYRLGYGKGFYDRFFQKYPDLKAKKIIVALNCFVCADFCEDPFDKKADLIISEDFYKIC